MYDLNNKKFYSINPKSKAYDVPAPAVDKLLKNKDFQKGIEKAMKYLGETTTK